MSCECGGYGGCSDEDCPCNPENKKKKMKNKPLKKVYYVAGDNNEFNENVCITKDVISAREWFKEQIDEMDIWVSTKKEIAELIKQAFDV